MGAASTVLIVVLGLFLSALAVRVLMLAAPTLRLVDVPGGRKNHGTVIPLVGGLSIFIALLVCGAFLGFSGAQGSCLVALSLVIAIALWDDGAESSPRRIVAVQIIASAVMSWGADIELRSVG